MIRTRHCWIPVMALMGAMTTVNAADIEAGKEVSAACAACHGADGNSNNAAWPILAGQQSEYLKTQLEAFHDGTRPNEVMQNIAAGLSPDAIENLAAYYAAQTPKSAGGNPDLAAAGESLYAACAGCHGEKAEGSGIYPRLAGQHPDYTALQVRNFQSGKRDNTLMKAMVATLSEDDIKAVAAYLGSLQ